MELLEGETLRARLAGGALPVRKAVEFGARSPPASRPRTRRASSTATSSPRTSSSRRTGASRSSTSASRNPTNRSVRGARTLRRLEGTEPGAVSERSDTCHPSSCADYLPTTARISSASGRSSTRCSPGARRSGATRRRTRSGDSSRGAPRPLRDEPDHPAGARAHRAPLPREEPGRTRALGARRRVRSRVVLDGVFGNRRDLGSADRHPPAVVRRPPRGGRVSGRRHRGGRAPLETAGARAADVPPPHVPAREHHRRPLCPRRPDDRLRRRLGGKSSEIFTVRTEGPESRPLGITNATVAAVSSSGELAILTRDAMKSIGSLGDARARAAFGRSAEAASRGGH